MGAECRQVDIQPRPTAEEQIAQSADRGSQGDPTGVGRDGKPTAGEWTIVNDGRDTPLTGNPDADVLSLKRTDAFSTEFTLKKAGKVVITGTRTISRDGKVMTIINTGTNAKGQTIDDVMVFEKR